MGLILKTPIVTPIVISKTLDALWVSRMTLFSDAPELPVKVSVELIPYNSLTKEPDRERSKTTRFSDFMTEVSGNPDLVNALQDIYNIIGKIAIQKGLFDVQ